MAAFKRNTCAAACACHACSRICFAIDQIFCTMRVYGWMLDAYVVDFFQENLWSKLPSSWQDILDGVMPEELGQWILEESGNKRVWPLSLLALRVLINNIQIPRDYKRDAAIRCFSNVRQTQKTNSKENDQVSAKDQRFDNLFKKHVKTKKRYEIDVISKIAADCASKAGCTCVVDVGAGMGHLARVLAYRYDLKVTCVEQNPALLEGARKWDKQLAESLGKYLSDFRERKPPHQLAVRVEASSSARRQLAEQLTLSFGAEEFDGFGLIGLHPCGDLAATLLRFYSNEQSVKFICIVGCCYMKLTLSGDVEKGYPMSQHVTTRGGNNQLSYAALEVACHALEKHCDKLKTNDFYDLIVHAYRAVLEFLLVEKNPALRRRQLKNTKVKDNTEFKEYCKVATEVLDPKDRPTDLDYERTDVKDFLKQWKRVLIFSSLRLFLAPLVETLVLFDRFLYLSEMQLSPSLKAEFDSRISPRNFVLSSVKKKK
ncbi:methyltransferase-like protein 25B isoform X2 [Phymastichus coffea]|uniref:methyltransferase-like protein 25B isoform X2 n=1 Tax=Phymastichus coffea TaxID=108790 RepID=UPI00273C7D31|nr:methyltransferase-like protein 25B isoform X2 [Phymastichus coffea]